jgi:hypothetical protein
VNNPRIKPAQQKPKPTTKPKKRQVHPTARSKFPRLTNVNATLFRLHPKSTAQHHFGKASPNRVYADFRRPVPVLDQF